MGERRKKTVEFKFDPLPEELVDAVRYAAGFAAGLEAAARVARVACVWCAQVGQKYHEFTIQPAHDEGDQGWYHDLVSNGPYDGDPVLCAAAAVRALAAAPVDTPKSD